MSPPVFVRKVSRFLPNRPVSNDHMERYLGMVGGKQSRSKGLVLRRNKIHTRYYAVDEQGQSTHSNAALTAEAVKALYGDDFPAEGIELLCCGTTSPDLLLPSHASMVHGELGLGPVEAVGFSGSCNSGMSALKYAFMALSSGLARQAVATGSEKLSSWMLSKNFVEESKLEQLEQLERRPVLAFEKDFLRWMLSDGAAAVGLTLEPASAGTSYRVEWVDSASYAHEVPACMYAGGEPDAQGKLLGWRDHPPQEWLQRSLFSLKQDVHLLDRWIVPLGIRHYQAVMARHQLGAGAVDHFLPHISSMYFQDRVGNAMAEVGLGIDLERWFINLSSVGNIGSAAPFAALEELPRAKAVRDGDRVLLFVPESARFSYTFALLTAVVR